MLVVLCCTAMLALVGVIRTGQPATSSSSAAAAHSAGSAVHTTSGGSASASLTGSASGASAANPGAFNTVSGGS